MNSSAALIPSPSSAISAPIRSITILRDRDEILAMQPQLARLAARSGQDGEMDHLAYFFERPQFASKSPCLILLRSTPDSAFSAAGELLGAVLLYEYRAFGRGLGIFVADFYADDSTVIAPLPDRADVAAEVAGELTRKGARAVLLTFRNHGLALEKPHFGDRIRGRHLLSWAVRERPAVGQLPLARTVEDTLASMGKHTRRNLRYYRRRAAAELGCTFIPDPDMSREELRELNSLCTHPMPEDLLGWRFNMLQTQPGLLLLGLRSGEDQWLSVIAGRRQRSTTVIEWQMNRADFPSYSLCTVMRSHLIEHETARGTEMLKFQGGTAHSIRSSFLPGQITDLITLRRSPSSLVLRRLAKRLFPEDNFLRRALTDPSLDWKHW